MSLNVTLFSSMRYSLATGLTDDYCVSTLMTFNSPKLYLTLWILHFCNENMYLKILKSANGLNVWNIFCSMNNDPFLISAFI